MRHVRLLWPFVFAAGSMSACADDPDHDRPASRPATANDLPTTRPAEAPRPAFTDADFAARIRQLRPHVPAGFTILVEPPFVVIGDEDPAVVRRRAEHTVKWAVARLRQDYFTEDPAHIYAVWLFKDKTSYENHTRSIFGEAPTTPFGYCSQQHRALIMNIATGGGTLVHEIVHAFMHSNFPACPTWFNEGLASLYEQSGERDGHIAGHTNWRLAGLQEAIKRGGLPTIEALVSMTPQQFYGQDRGTNYAQARYLCHYLQEKGLLVRFYRELHARHERDPTGFDTLQRVLGHTDMMAFQTEWEAWVLTLRFPQEAVLRPAGANQRAGRHAAGRRPAVISSRIELIL